MKPRLIVGLILAVLLVLTVVATLAIVEAGR